jgi:hypothetical protein
LLTNGSLLKGRLDQLDRDGDLRKISLWITHHHTEISVDRFIKNARIAQERYGCFVVVNGLLFPDNEAAILELKQAADLAGLRFNLDFGYDPRTPHAVFTTFAEMVPAQGKTGEGLARMVELGANEELLQLNLSAMRDLEGRTCSAGHDYFYIDIRGNVYRCSRYQAQDRERMGNVLDDRFQLQLNGAPRAPCKAGFGCCNKEDFLNLLANRHHDGATPSLGWIGASPRTSAAPQAREADKCARRT